MRPGSKKARMPVILAPALVAVTVPGCVAVITGSGSLATVNGTLTEDGQRSGHDWTQTSLHEMTWVGDQHFS